MDFQTFLKPGISGRCFFPQGRSAISEWIPFFSPSVWLHIHIDESSKLMRFHLYLNLKDPKARGILFLSVHTRESRWLTARDCTKILSDLREGQSPSAPDAAFIPTLKDWVFPLTLYRRANILQKSFWQDRLYQILKKNLKAYCQTSLTTHVSVSRIMTSHLITCMNVIKWIVQVMKKGEINMNIYMKLLTQRSVSNGA